MATTSQPVARPAFPPQQSSTSTNASSYQSYNSAAASLSAPSPASAPLPSPSSSYPPQQQDFFGSLNQQQRPQQLPQQGQTGQQQAYDYRPNREGAGRTAAETNNFLSTSALLAEAAKRAQMAVVMRDIEGMEL